MAFRSAGTATSVAVATASGTAGSPAGFVANDILIIVVSSDLAALAAPTWPTGFTQLYWSSISAPDGQSVGAAWKRAAGGDSLAVSGLGTTASKIIQCFAWSGRDTGNPPVAGTVTVNTTGNASPVTATAPTVTALANDDIFWVCGPDITASTTSTLTPPTGYTTRSDQVDTINGADWIKAATKDAVSAGATGSIAGSYTLGAGTSGWAAALVRIPVASGAAIPPMGWDLKGDQNPQFYKVGVIAN